MFYVIRLCRTSAWSASSRCTGRCPGHCLCHLLSEQGPLLCPDEQYWGQGVWLRHGGPHRLWFFLPQLHLVPLLIAESWVERCEERLWVWTERVYELRDKDRKRGWSRGHGACWSWGTERLPAASVQHKGEWASRYREELSNSLFLVHIHFYPACFKTVVPDWSNFCTDNAHWRNQIQLFKITCCSQTFTKWNLIVYIRDV